MVINQPICTLAFTLSESLYLIQVLQDEVEPSFHSVVTSGLDNIAKTKKLVEMHFDFATLSLMLRWTNEDSVRAYRQVDLTAVKMLMEIVQNTKAKDGFDAILKAQALKMLERSLSYALSNPLFTIQQPVENTTEA